MYGPGGPGAFPPPDPSAFSAFPAGGFPPLPTGSWGPSAGGGFPPAPGPFGPGPGPMGPYGGPAAPGGMLVSPSQLFSCRMLSGWAAFPFLSFPLGLCRGAAHTIKLNQYAKVVIKHSFLSFSPDISHHIIESFWVEHGQPRLNPC